MSRLLLERPEKEQTLELLRLLVNQKLTRKMTQRILEKSIEWFKKELCQKLLSLAKEETSRMKDGEEHNTRKTLCLALIASATKNEDDIEALRRAISSEKYLGLNYFILLASITKDQRDIGVVLEKVVFSDDFTEEIDSFVRLTDITGDSKYIEMARKKLSESAGQTKNPKDWYWIAGAADNIAAFTQVEKDILFVRKSVSKMEKDDYYLKSGIMISLFGTTGDDADSNFARKLISKIPHLDLKKNYLAELAMFTRDPCDILAAREAVENNDGEALCYIAKATLSSRDINRAYRAVSGGTRLFMTGFGNEDLDGFDTLLSAAIEAKRFDVVESLISEASGYPKVRDCIRAYKKIFCNTFSD